MQGRFWSQGVLVHVLVYLVTRRLEREDPCPDAGARVIALVYNRPALFGARPSHFWGKSVSVAADATVRGLRGTII
jgi:hypothetical protein